MRLCRRAAPVGAAVGLLATLLWPGCAREIEGAEPPQQALYYPIGLQISSCDVPGDVCSAYVVSSNFDRRFSSGWVSVIDIDALLKMIDASCAPCAADSACVVPDPVTCNALVGGARPAFCSDSDSSCHAVAEASRCGNGCADYRTCVDDGAGGAICAAEPFLNNEEVIVQQLKIPSLGGQMAIAPDDSLAVVATRGAQPIVLIEMTGGRDLSCGVPDAVDGLTSELQKTDCDRFHLTRLVAVDPLHVADYLASHLEQLGELEIAADELLPADQLNIQEVAADRRFNEETPDADAITEEAVADPYAVHIVDRQDDSVVGKLHVAIGYLGGGFISVLEVLDTVPRLLKHKRLVGPFNTGVGAIAVYPGDAESTYMVATSQRIDPDSDLSSLFDIDLGRTLDGDKDRFRIHPIGDSFGGFEMLDIVFAQSGSTAPRAYVVNRNPDSVTVIDTRLEESTVRNADGTYEAIVRPRYLPIASVSLPGRPSGLAYVPRAGVDLLAVTSFQHDALFILSIFGDRLRVDRRIDWIGAGPYQVRHVRRGGRDILLVISFFDHSLAVVDVTSDDPQEFELIGRVRAADSVTSDARARN